jgi:hypothetical protein
MEQPMGRFDSPQHLLMEHKEGIVTHEPSNQYPWVYAASGHRLFIQKKSGHRLINHYTIAT